jgi:hypothetical protein
MGKGWEGIEASSNGSENNSLGTCEAHHVGGRPQEDRGGAAGTLGEGAGGEEEGGVRHDARIRPAASVALLILLMKNHSVPDAR